MGVVSHIGYISSTDYSYGFGIFSRMAIHTAAGFEIIGASLVTIAWRETRKKTNRIPEWLAIPVGISVAAIAFVLWQTLAIDEDIKIERSINIRSESAALKIENQFTQPAQALIRMGVIWEIEGGTSRELWEAQALSYLSSISSMKAIALIDPSLRVQWVMPPGAVNRLQDLDLSLNPKQKTVIEEAIESRATTDANSIEGAQAAGVVNVYVPIFIDNQFDGLILAELDVDALLQPVSEEFDAVGYVLALYEDDTEVYVSPNAEERAEQWEHTSNFEIQGKTWHMAIWPTEDRLGELKTNIPLFTLFTGLLMAAITAVGINQAQTAGSRARLIAETNLELSAEVRRRTAVEQNLRDLNTNLVSRTSDLQEATTNLEIEVEERKRIEESLVSNTHELERSNSELERFAYVASHDLQTPIRTIIGFSQILAEDYSGKLDPAADDIISRIVDSGSYMQNLINDLLEYSRIGSNYTAGETVDCEALVKKQINVFEQEIRDSHTVITCENLPVIQGERTMLDQVFRNLIGNALKYRNKQPNLIHISGQVTENEWVISVKDNGIGMEPQYLQRIFGIFQRLHLREEYEGTGIGLAICKKAVERLGGRIWVESVRGEGSTFFFTIPMPVENNSQNWPDNGERPNNSTADL
jgi:signal transduction histidine kinase